MKIKLKIFSAFVLAVIVLAVSGITAFYYFSYGNLQSLAANNLSTAAKNKASWLNTYLAERRGDAEVLVALPLVEQMFVAGELDLTAQLYLQEWQIARGYQDVILINPDGHVWWTAESFIDAGADLDSSEYNKTSLADSYHKAVNNNQVVISDYGRHQTVDEPAIFLAAPVYVNQKLVGVVALQLQTSKIDSIMQDQTGLGKTGKTYLVGPDYLMRSDSGDIKNSSILTQTVDTVNARQCFGSYEEEVAVGKDYRSVSSLGTHVYIPAMNWCLLAEIDEAEAFDPLIRLKWVYLMIALILLLAAYLVADLVSRNISKPIIELQEGTEIIKKGNLNHKVGTDAGDEIGELSRLFDKMVVAIKHSRREVDRKVKEQTKEIRMQKRKLEKDHDLIVRMLDQVRKEKDRVVHERDKINAILHGIGDGVFFIDKDHKVMMFNDSAMEMSGFGSREVLGKKYDNLLKFKYQEDKKVYHKFIEDTIKSGKMKEMAHHVLLQKKDGKYVPVNAIATLLKDDDGKTMGCVVVLRDMTMEEKVEKMKTEFVSLASHQLRTPLSAVRWFLEMIIDGEAGKLNEEQERIMHKIATSNDRMIKLVNGLLNISRIEAGRMMVEPELTDMIRLIKVVIAELRPLIKAHNHKFKLVRGDKIPKINVDPKLINQVVMNFLSNAIKYTPGGGKIEVEIKKVGNSVRIAVKDDGLGVPKDQQGSLFKKFFRANNVSSTSIKGTGLGLYVTKSIVKASGGQIGFKSTEGKGSTFWFSLPLTGSKRIEGEKSLEYFGVHG